MGEHSFGRLFVFLYFVERLWHSVHTFWQSWMAVSVISPLSTGVVSCRERGWRLSGLVGVVIVRMICRGGVVLLVLVAACLCRESSFLVCDGSPEIGCLGEKVDPRLFIVDVARVVFCRRPRL